MGKVGQIVENAHDRGRSFLVERYDGNREASMPLWGLAGWSGIIPKQPRQYENEWTCRSGLGMRTITDTKKAR